ncbi:leucine--tRNA ligase [Catenaria anguillulae PL171]|uniref:leucine--tRNA ligase n=1 Tax=Catenaria anguillulae PL171 TaxID=765915 RepID=A0A1Y2I441_9FUNG|nr:leucine--tRNA ligase [Catenaria anguillulae PL171]
MFPYPSGDLHMGHVRVYTLSDMLARFHRMQGKHVIHPMGWDAFGLPAENAALERGISPRDWTLRNIAHMKGQLQLIGLDLDWERELATCQEEYYRHTQALFLKLWEKRLAYRKEAVVNWDPVDKTVLANEQVDSEGKSWRSGAVVEKKSLEQWFFKITDYAEELLAGLDQVDWPQEVKQMQRNWIGKSQGMQFTFPLSASNGEPIQVFTSRPETLMGVTFLAISPSHPLVTSPLVPSSNRATVQSAAAAYLKQQHQFATSDPPKEGTPLGLSATHPITGAQIPIYVTNYVLPDYGSGAVMGVPAHDDRDAAFAQSNKLPVIHVWDAESGRVLAQTGGPLANMSRTDAMSYLAANGIGQPKTQYRLRDWLVSRQRYWGCPIPMIHCPTCGPVGVPAADLPVRVPDAMGDFSDPVRLKCTCPKCQNTNARRDPDTMDTFVDSSWYFMRYLDPHNTKVPFSPSAARAGMAVDLYVGGIEHAILHLLYARFFTKFVHDHVTPLPTTEPFAKLLAQGMVHGKTMRDAHSGKYLKPHELEVDAKTGEVRVKSSGMPPRVTYEKMSKSKYNGVAPEDVIAAYGSDVARAYIIAKAPPNQVLEWDEDAVVGWARWLNRVWGLVSERVGKGGPVVQVVPSGHKWTKEEKQVWVTVNELHQQISTSLENTATLNTYPSNLIKLTHALSSFTFASTSPVYDVSLTRLIQLMAPLTPSLAQELWTNQLTHSGTVWDTWPRPEQVQADVVQVVVQVNGKTRGTVSVERERLANVQEYVMEETEIGEKWIRGKGQVKKVVVVNGGKLVNFILGK